MLLAFAVVAFIVAGKFIAPLRSVNTQLDLITPRNSCPQSLGAARVAGDAAAGGADQRAASAYAHRLDEPTSVFHAGGS